MSRPRPVFIYGTTNFHGLHNGDAKLSPHQEWADGLNFFALYEGRLFGTYLQVAEDWAIQVTVGDRLTYCEHTRTLTIEDELGVNCTIVEVWKPRAFVPAMGMVA